MRRIERKRRARLSTEEQKKRELDERGGVLRVTSKRKKKKKQTVYAALHFSEQLTCIQSHTVTAIIIARCSLLCMKWSECLRYGRIVCRVSHMCLAMSSSSLSCFHKRKLPTLFSAPESVAFEGSICSTVCMKSENPFKRMKRRRSAAKMVGGSGCSPIVARSCFTPICNVSSMQCVREREHMRSTPNARGSSFHAAICEKWWQIRNFVDAATPTTTHCTTFTHSHAAINSHFSAVPRLRSYLGLCK